MNPKANKVIKTPAKQNSANDLELLRGKKPLSNDFFNLPIGKDPEGIVRAAIVEERRVGR